MDMSDAVKFAARDSIAPDMPPLAVERATLHGFLRSSRAEHKEIYRIIDEAEFVDPVSYRTHYETIAARILERLRAGMDAGAFDDRVGKSKPGRSWA